MGKFISIDELPDEPRQVGPPKPTLPTDIEVREPDGSFALAPTEPKARRFIPLEELPEEPAAPVRPKPEPEKGFLQNVGETAVDSLVGLGKGVTFGFGDELAGVAGATLDQFREGGGVGDFMRNYRAHRADAQEVDKAASERSPIAHTVAEIGGSVATPVPALSGLKATSLAGKIGKGALQSAIVGAPAALGESRADLTQGDVGGAVLDIGEGTALSASGGGGISGIIGLGGKITAKAAPALRRYLSDFAADRAVKAAGAIQSDIKGIPVERRREMGRQLLDQDTIKPFADSAAVGREVGAAKERFGASIGDKLTRADEQVAARAKTLPAQRGAGGRFTPKKDAAGDFDYRPVLERLKKAVAAMDPVERDAAASATRLIDKIEEQAALRGGFARANKLKGSVQKGVNWKSESPGANAFKKQIQGVIDDEVETQLERQLGPQLASEFKTDKQLYGTMAEALKWSKKAGERDAGNRFVSLSDLMTGLGLAGVGGIGSAIASDNPAGGLASIPLGVATALGARAVRRRGSSAAAVAAKTLLDNKVPERAGKALLDASDSPKLTRAELAALRQWLDAQNEKEK